MFEALLKEYAAKPGERFFDEIFNKGEYTEVKNLGPLKTVLDLGALAGEFSFYVYSQAEKIYAIEPYPLAFGELARNVEKYGSEKIVPVYLAIAGDNLGRWMRENGVRGGWGTTKEPLKDGFAVNSMSLANFMDLYQIDEVDLLKTDCEGAETEIFTASDFPEVASKIKYIIGEHFDEDLTKHLVNLGFEVKELAHAKLFRRKE